MQGFILDYPKSSEITMDLRPCLHPVFSSLAEGISEFTFANIYLFRKIHAYRVSKLNENILITGRDSGKGFFMLPCGLPQKGILKELLERFSSLKCASEAMAITLRGLGFCVTEDRDNFDYLYLREEMSALSGRRFHKKKNLVNAFVSNYSYEGKPLITELLPDALRILDEWRRERGAKGDYEEAKEALERMEELELCGGIYYVDGKPAAYTLGEELSGGAAFAVHFEKGIDGYKGLMQFVSQAFASILPEKYLYINREQDLGIEGLRQSKMSLRPVGFIKKYRVDK